MGITSAETRHFLRRVGFGPSATDEAHFLGREIDDVVDEVLNASMPRSAEPPDLHLEQGWVAQRSVVPFWVDRMVRSRWADRGAGTPNPLQERMTLFWHGHFCSAYKKVRNMPDLWTQNQLFRSDGLGDFESLVQQVAVGNAMLHYLDNDDNVSGVEQENFARELMELFTIGIGNFTEDDVVSMAKAWTGHNTIGWLRNELRRDNTYVFYADEHDTSDKTLFGITKDWDGPETITEICRGVRQRATAEFIAAKVWRFFVGVEPTAEVVAELADAFVASDMNITELMRAVLSHPQFWTLDVRYALVKSPTDFVVSYLRHVDVDLSGLALFTMMTAMGQALFDPPDVGGWGENGHWLSTATTWARAKFVQKTTSFLADDTYLEDLPLLDPAAAVDQLLAALDVTIASDETRAHMETWYQDTYDNARWTLRKSGLLVTAMLPEFQVM